jgi:hypothetical protein
MNITVDDNVGNDSVLSYEPSDHWSFGPACTQCVVKPDPQKVSDGTWHDTSAISQEVPANMTLKFTGMSRSQDIANSNADGVPGTAVYLFCIVPNTVPGAGSSTVNLTFTLDGQSDGTFLHQPDGTQNIIYNVPVYARTSLDNKPHTLVMSPVAGINSSLVLFDYAVYTFV